MASGPITAESSDAAGFTPARRRFAFWVIYGVIGVHVVAMIAKIDQWPLSNYGMYSRIQAPHFLWQLVYGLTEDGREVPLQDDTYWEPLGATRLSLSLRRMQQDAAKQAAAGSSGQGDQVDRAVASLLVMYEANRRNGLHDGPRLAGLRLYNVTWQLDPRLANLDAPEQRELVNEYVAQR